jgi:hypothetical protein
MKPPTKQTHQKIGHTSTTRRVQPAYGRTRERNENPLKTGRLAYSSPVTVSLRTAAAFVQTTVIAPAVWANNLRCGKVPAKIAVFAQVLDVFLCDSRRTGRGRSAKPAGAIHPDNPDIAVFFNKNRVQHEAAVGAVLNRQRKSGHPRVRA